MIKKLIYGGLLMLVTFASTRAQIGPPAALGPIPTENQMRWQQMEYYAFLHFSINTFTDQEWGYGEDAPATFNPTELDCRQWARVCKEAGMKGIITTAKHHSGFCLWPSKYTEYSVKNSPWKNGKGDIVGELAAACKEYGLKLGIYLSPWDRNYADYGRPEYITYFRNQLKELLTNYGDIFEIWFDGANGGSGYYGGTKETRKIDRKTYYDWKNTYNLIRQLQPNIVIWNDGGDRGDLRWVGTEDGYVGETNWSLLMDTGDVPEDMLRHGLENGNAWVPGEVNTSIRPGWFYHAYEDTRVKTLPQLMKLYYQSIGRNGTLLLNFPIDCRGLIHETDAANAREFAKTVKESFSENLASKAKVTASNIRGNSKMFSGSNTVDGKDTTYWATDDNVKTGELIFDFGKPVAFNNFMVSEYIRLGQRVKKFKVEAMVKGTWKELASETTIGYKRILRFPATTATKVRLSITDTKGCPLIASVGIYNAPLLLTPPVISRDKNGVISIKADDPESEIYYTLDGTLPAKTSLRYREPISTSGKVAIKAISYDAQAHKASIPAMETFDISKANWRITTANDTVNLKANNVIDGNQWSAWYQSNKAKIPVDLIIDLGQLVNIKGFKYLPGQGRVEGIIADYQFYVSEDNKTWKMVDEGEFSNIKNNPLWQVKTFSPVKARYIKLRAIKNTLNDNTVGYAEIDIITD